MLPRTLPLARLGLAAAALSWSLAACGSPSDAAWSVRFEGGAAPGGTVSVHTEVRTGGCGGTARFADDVGVGEGAGASPGALPPGVYGFYGEARDADCNVVADGCVEVEVPVSGDIVVTLAPATSRPACAAAMCSAGICGVSPDMGPDVDLGPAPDLGPSPDLGPDPADLGADPGDLGPLPSDMGSPPELPCDLPWGGTVASGSAVPAYSATSVACGVSCGTVAESRACNDGTLSGSFTNESCTPAACPCALPWGGTIASGATVQAYSAASVPCGGACAALAETRTCTNGTLSGSFSTAACSVDACAPCSLPWGATIASGASATAYSASSVACGGTCTTVAETRTCDDGVLSGTYANAACSVGSCACALPWGGSVANGTSVTAYQASSVACGTTCVSEARTCTAGVLSGSYGSAACTVAPCSSCVLPWGGTIANGASIPAFSATSVACGGSCSTVSENRVCNNGTLSGSYTNASCAPVACPCTLPWGGTIASGSSTTAYSAASVACGGACGTVSETRTCANGVLSGTFTNVSCTVGSCASCALPWGGTLASGSATTAYAAGSVACGSSCTSQTRTCSDGVLSGSYTSSACSVAACACTLPWGGSIADGTGVTAYQAASVTCGNSCASQVRTCSGGVLSGTYTSAACTVGACASCALPWGGSIASGSSTTAYSATSVACGGSCGTVSQTRTCTNGTLSGSFMNASCAALSCPCTLPWGGSIASGSTTTAYAAASVPCGGSCGAVSQTRTCMNGVLSGTYTSAACLVGACAPCDLPWLGTIAHGASVVAYVSDCAVNCASQRQTRTCDNGVLSGVGDFQTCAAPPCL